MGGDQTMILLLGISENEQFVKDFKDKDDSIFSCSTIEDAKHYIDLHTIDEIIVDAEKFTKKDLNILNNYYVGVVIGKVNDEKYGFELIHNSLIKDYFICNANQCSLQKCLDRVKVKSNIKKASDAIQENLSKLASLIPGK